jgi:AraC-like DNA-binding protein
MYEEPALTEHDGSGFGVQIDLTAEGGYALVDGPLDELANRVVSLEEVCPQLATGRLVDRLLSARSLAERIVALRQEVALSVTGARRLSPEVAWVHRQLRREPNTKVGRLASELNWRPARLVNAFRREVGLPPKSIGRLARFDRARDHLAGGKPITLAEIAARCGYADQAHFNREFRAFSGRTPTQWRSEQSAG